MQALSIAFGGMSNAIKAFDASAARTVRDSLNLTQSITSDPQAATASPSDGDFVSNFVDQTLSSHAFSANVAVAKTGDEMMGSLLDIKA